jgi:hypothetical protein
VRVDVRLAGFVPLGVVSALLIAAPTALADPLEPTPEPVPPAAQDAAAPQASQQGTPHLASPQNLPPGTSDEPVGPQEGRNLGYLRDLWHAVQSQDMSGKQAALLFVTQRPMDPNATPPPGLAAGPQAPPGAEPAPAGPVPTP